MQNKNIYLDEKGYADFLDSIEKLKKDLKEVEAGRVEAFNASSGDGWDTPEFEEIERVTRSLTWQISQKYEELSRIVIVKRSEDDDLVDIGDIVETEIKDSTGDIENLTFLLVGGQGDVLADIPEISLNSPLGQAVYQRKIGESVTFSVDKRDSNLKIISKTIDNNKERGK